jgi:cyclopropane fatty-acyl-phospholipid synthase-like methyltransferase
MWYVDTSLSFERPDLATFRTNARRIAEVSLEHFDPDPRRHVALDIGCGLGRVIEELAPRFRHVVGLDVSAEMLRQADEAVSARNRSFVVTGGEDLAMLRDGAVDFVVSFAVFTHLPSVRWTERYIHEIARVLRPGGGAAFHLNTSATSLRWAIRRWALSLSGRLGRDQRGRLTSSFLGSAMSVSKVCRIVDAAGLETLEIANGGTLHTIVHVMRPAAVTAGTPPAVRGLR